MASSSQWHHGSHYTSHSTSTTPRARPESALEDPPYNRVQSGPSTPRQDALLRQSPSTLDQARRTALPPGLSPHTPPFNRSRKPVSSRQASPSTHNTLHRAIHTTLPDSPASKLATPPSAFPSRLHEAVELRPLSPPKPGRDSPFDDRYSIGVASANDLEGHVPVSNSGHRRQRTMDGDRFSSTSPRSSQTRQLETATSTTRVEARRSLYPSGPPIPITTLNDHPDLAPPRATTTPNVPLRPTFRGLFAFHTKTDYTLYLLPAVIFSVASSLVQPYMSRVIGDAFNAFVQYPLDNSLATEAQRTALKEGVRVTTIKLAATGAAAVVLNYIKGVLWARHGENLTNRLRHAVYEGVQGKSMEWFDLGMGMKIEGKDSEAIGAGGLMAKFTRETDDVRIACSQALGLVIQNASTFIACFILALATKPVLALVTLSTIPLVILIQIVTQVVCAPLYTRERRAFAEASTNIERATTAIATVKAHNAQKSEAERFERVVSGAMRSLIRQAMVWALSISSAEFLILGTFVVGFWYGAQVVREGKASPGTVMTVFWACLLAATYLQIVIPQLTVVTKGKNSMASLRSIIQSRAVHPTSISNPFSAHESPSVGVRPSSIRGIRPAKCRGEFNLKNICFAYPSRPENVVLQNITLFIPPGETTFIVGGSGSGKSTVAQLLLRLYDPNGGLITLDDQTFSYLDEGFTRENIAAVQHGCILFDASIHENVAMGVTGAGIDRSGVKRRPEDVSRAEVIEACKMAMIHDFIESLPEGYETNLGTGGSALSGGQRQRLAIARARIRDPTVLILDEATSALDATSRVTIFENIKTWRRNQATIVITHDLSQIVSEDFVYVMQNGVVAEQGFRSDLIKKTPLNGQSTGVFASMAAEQATEPLPPKMEEWKDTIEVLADEEFDAYEEVPERREIPFRPHTPSFGIAGRESMAYFDILEQYAKGSKSSVSGKRLSTVQRRLSWSPSELDKRASRASLPVLGPPINLTRSRASLVVPPRPESMLARYGSPRPASRATVRSSLDIRTISPHQTPHSQVVTLEKEDQGVLNELRFSYVQSLPKESPVIPEARPSIFRLLAMYLPTLPRRYYLLLGLSGAIAHGVTTPIWSFFLSKLMTIVGTGGTDPSLTKFGLIVLALCAAQALADWTQQYFLYALAAMWTNKLRSEAYNRVLSQEKGWFDDSVHAPVRIVQSLIKDADDMRLLIASVLGKFTVFVIMVSLGIIWAMIVDWRLTMIGVALAPVFATIMTLNNSLIGKAEVRNKAKREAVAKTFYESVANIRGIRAMALEGTFDARFEDDALSAEKSGKRTGWAISIGIGFVASMPLFAQALMNWAGSEFILKGYINYAQMLQVYNLVLFSLTFGTAMLDFIPSMAKARAAAFDFDKLYSLSTATTETSGDFRFPISGQVSFSNVGFSYPTRPDVPVLERLSLTLHPGEAVAIVGPSGCGKSTIAALLQKLYEPTSGSIYFDRYDLARADVKWLRDHIAVVSQSANLFDASVSQNIAYGSQLPIGEIQRAARAANIHDFIQSLPEGYDTNLGENASLISGGQAQRLQIARALVRRSRILILDECTSALDVDNQRAILDTIVKIKETRTTVFITHSLEAMKRCDRIICLGEGRVVEEGSFEELIRRGGTFAQLMQTGEWE